MTSYDLIWILIQKLLKDKDNNNESNNNSTKD